MTAFLLEHVSCDPNGMVEYWIVDLNKGVTHLLTSLSRGILTIPHIVQNKFIHCYILPEPTIPWPRPLAQTWLTRAGFYDFGSPSIATTALYSRQLALSEA